MRQITKDIQITIDGSPKGFRLTKPDAFSGVEILRLLLRLQDQWEDGAERGDGFACSTNVELQNRPRRSAATSPTIMDLITSLSSDELRSVMTSCLNHVSVLLPVDPNPIMTGSEWGYPELKHDTFLCKKLVLEEIDWVLEGFFGDGGSKAEPASPNYFPLTCPNIDDFLFLPVALGFWKQHELWDGTYTLDDLLDIAELAEVRREKRKKGGRSRPGVKGVQAAEVLFSFTKNGRQSLNSLTSAGAVVRPLAMETLNHPALLRSYSSRLATDANTS